MSRLQAPKGFEDVLPAASWKWQAVERIAREISELYHFHEIRTPVMEHSELFHRGVGETSDIIHKETFTFTNRGGDSVTLRPEGTAGVVRAMIEHNLLAQEGARQKVFYIAPNFRYENPQKGRLRQHHQFGAEAFGVADPEQDVECILLQMDFYRRCGLRDLKLRVNSLGDKESKQKFSEAIVRILTPKKSELSEDSQRRLDDNPLRILDSKDPRDRDATANILGMEFLSAASSAHLDRLQRLLNEARVDYLVDGKLVRGFDYYTGTVWEVTAEGLGSQNAVGGGGRYDNLVENLGGRPTPGVGFGSGLERLLIALEAQGAQLPRPTRPLLWLIAIGNTARDAQFQLLRELRDGGIAADMDLSPRSPKAQFKVADREHANYALTVGEAELQAKTVVLKNLSNREETTIPRDELIPRLRQLT
jgi:histidyl-tRNA synthetase